MFTYCIYTYTEKKDFKGDKRKETQDNTHDPREKERLTDKTPLEPPPSAPSRPLY